MSTMEAIQPMILQLSEADLIKVREYLKKLLLSSDTRSEAYNPFTPLSREEILQQLEIARNHATQGKVQEAHQISRNVRDRYGL